MRIAVADLAAHARPLPALVARDALEALALQRLAHGLVLELVILAVPLAANVALVHSPSMTPHITMALRTLDAQGPRIRTLSEGTCAGVLLDTLLGMTYKRLAEIANRPYELHSRHCGSRMLHQTVRADTRTLHSSAVRANGELLYLLVIAYNWHYGVTEIAEGAVLLFHSALLALHLKVSRHLRHVSVRYQLRRSHQP